MSYWWVNQGDTYELERNLGLLWAPMFDSRGHRKSHWESMDRGRGGDVVFHYANSRIRGVSRILVESRRADRPYETNQWGVLGRELRVDFQEFDLPMPLSDVPLDLRISLRHLNSPFTKKGLVNVGYFYDLTPEAGDALLELTGMVETTGNEVSDEPLDPGGEKRQFVFGDIGTDGKRTVLFRREQSKLRRFLFGRAPAGQCAICGRELPVQFLVTAHIKPRSLCSESERLDENVVVPLCVLGCDYLFENGHVVVEQDGRIRSRLDSYPAPHHADLTAQVETLSGRFVSPYSEANVKYFQWHRSHHASKREHNTAQRPLKASQ